MISFKRSGHKAYVPTGYTGSNYYYYCYFYVTKFMLFYMYVCFFFYHGSMPCVSATIRDCLSLWDRWIDLHCNSDQPRLHSKTLSQDTKQNERSSRKYVQERDVRWTQQRGDTLLAVQMAIDGSHGPGTGNSLYSQKSASGHSFRTAGKMHSTAHPWIQLGRLVLDC